MTDEGPTLAGQQMQRFRSLYDLLIAELGDIFTSAQAAVFRYAQHELRADRPISFDLAVHGLQVLSELATVHDRPDLARKVQGVLRADVTVSSYAGPPLTRAQLRKLKSLYDLAAAELSGVLPPRLTDLRHRLRASRPVPDSIVVDGLRFLSHLAADQRRSDVVVKLLRAYLDLLSEEWPIWFNLGNHLVNLANLEGAITAYDEALRRNSAHAGIWHNRGRLHDDLGHHDQAMADWIEAARRDCDMAGFPDTITRRIVKAHGFVTMVRIIADPTLPNNQRQNLALALRRALHDAAEFDGWYLVRPPGPPREGERPLVTLFLHAELADIRRESPMLPGFFFERTATGYEARIVDEKELHEKLWYLPPGEPPGPPNRIQHLTRLYRAIRVGEAAEALEATWAIHYATGAIALSCLMDGAIDWPSPVRRLSVAGQSNGNGFHLEERERSTVACWITENTGADVTEHALTHFRAASDTLKKLSLATAEPDTTVVIDTEAATRFLTEYVAGPRGTLDQDDPLTLPQGSIVRAQSLWSFVEPVYREWVLAACHGRRPAARLTALCHARQFNTLAATELWREVPAEAWRAYRARLMTAYDPDVTVTDVQAALGPEAMLLDYYTYEVVGETVSQLTVTASTATVTTRDVDLAGGELAAMIQAGRPVAHPATGLPPLAERPLNLPTPLPGTLLVVPYGYLRAIPLHALPAVQSAIDRGEVDRVVYLPTVSSVCRQPDTPPHTRRALFVGYDPTGDIGLDHEVACLNSYADDVTVLTDDAATLATVLAEMPEHDLVHFACHGDVDPRLAAGYLQLADTRLYPWHLLSGPVPYTVVMNACLGIGVHRIETTSDGAFGLHDAFLVAGTRHVVGGLWELNEWTAQQFAASLYRHLASGQDLPAAVTNAQRDLRNATLDPFLWAPHACFGEWRACPY